MWASNNSERSMFPSKSVLSHIKPYFSQYFSIKSQMISIKQLFKPGKKENSRGKASLTRADASSTKLDFQSARCSKPMKHEGLDGGRWYPKVEQLCKHRICLFILWNILVFVLYFWLFGKKNTLATKLKKILYKNNCFPWNILSPIKAAMS